MLTHIPSLSATQFASPVSNYDLVASERAIGGGDEEIAIGVRLTVVQRVRSERHAPEQRVIDEGTGTEIVGIETLRVIADRIVDRRSRRH